MGYYAQAARPESTPNLDAHPRRGDSRDMASQLAVGTLRERVLADATLLSAADGRERRELLDPLDLHRLHRQGSLLARAPLAPFRPCASGKHQAGPDPDWTGPHAVG